MSVQNDPNENEARVASLGADDFVTGSAAGASSSSKARRRILHLGELAAILILAFVVFSPTIRYSLVFDDFTQIVENPRLTSWSYVPGYFTTHLWANNPLDPPYYYRPLFLLWLRLMDAMLGPPGALWHLGSILAHLAATLSVFLLVRRLIGDWRGALLSAGIFAIHPIHTEAIGFVSSVSEPLFTMFIVACVYCYVGRKGPVSFASLLFAALAMFTKETGILAPALILAYEWTRSGFKRAVMGAAPYLIPAVLFFTFRMSALGTFLPKPPSNMSASAMVLTWPRVLASYAAHLVWPVHLSACYDIPIGTSIWPFLGLLVVVAGLVWLVCCCGENVRFGAAWFAITMLPVLGIRYLHADDYVHDRYLYLPSVGLVLILAVGLARLRVTPLRVAAACVAVLALCWETELDLRVWKDETSLFQRAVETAPRNPYAKNNLAAAYLDSNRPADALPLLQQVIAMRPGDRQGYYNISHCYHELGNDVEAARYYSIFKKIYAAEEAESRRH